MKKIKTFIVNSKTEVVESETDSFITDAQFGAIENCIPGDGSVLRELEKRFQNLQIKEMTIIEMDKCK